MTDILVRPPELRQISEQLKSSAKKIDAALQAIDNDILSLKGDKFLGNRANAVQANYAPKRDALIKAKVLVLGFSEDLQVAAEIFEKADQGQENGDIRMPEEPVGQKNDQDGTNFGIDFDVLKAIFSTIKLFLEKNPFLEGADVFIGAFDFFFRKLPEAEKAFRAWEDYNDLDSTQWDIQRSHELQQDAREALNSLGLDTFKDSFSLLTDKFGDNQLIQEAIVKLKDVTYTVEDWLQTVEFTTNE